MRVPFLWHISRFWPLWKYYYFWKLTKLRNCCNRALFDLYFNAEEDSAVARCWWSKRGNTSHSPTTHCALRSLLGMRMMIMTMLGSRIFQVVCLCGNLHDIRRSSLLSALLLDGWRVHCNVDMSFCRNFTKPRLTLPNPNHDHRRWLIETKRGNKETPLSVCLSVCLDLGLLLLGEEEDIGWYRSGENQNKSTQYPALEGGRAKNPKEANEWCWSDQKRAKFIKFLRPPKTEEGESLDEETTERHKTLELNKMSRSPR